MPRPTAFRTARTAATALCALAAPLAAPAAAQSDPWQMSVSIYGWASGIDASVGTPFGSVDADLSFSDVLDKLDFAFFGSIEAQRGTWVILGDLNYSDLSAQRDAPVGLLFSDAEIETQLTILSVFGGYAVVDRPDLRIEAGGGLRFYDVSTRTRLTGNPGVPDTALGQSGSWIDPTLGLHLRAPLSDRWLVRGFADVGGFGIGDASDLSWQIYAGAGYALNDRWTLEVGYRHLSIEQDLDGAPVSVAQSGPLFGVTARF